MSNHHFVVLFSHRSLAVEDHLYREIPCDFLHKYCLQCLQRSMQEFARNGQAPVCHLSRCDYLLSRFDISSIPLERRLSDRLLKLAKGQQRPYCSKCHFYVNITNDQSFDDHLDSCDELIPCEYCGLPFSFRQLEVHSTQCAGDTTSRDEKLANFILTRTRYPFTKDQIRFFIQQQSKNPLANLEPFSIVNDLAVFGSFLFGLKALYVEEIFF